MYHSSDLAAENNFWQTSLNKQDSDPVARTEFNRSCISICMPLPGYSFGDALFSQVMKINLLFVL